MAPSVLVVEDDVDVAVALSDLLEARGCTVHRMHDGESALDWLQDHGGAVDLIISDFRMDPLNGIEFLRRARRLAEAPTILYTAYPDLDVAMQAANLAHVARFVQKPGDPQQLVDAAWELATDAAAAKQRSAAFRRALRLPRPRAQD